MDEKISEKDLETLSEIDYERIAAWLKALERDLEQFSSRLGHISFMVGMKVMMNR